MNRPIGFIILSLLLLLMAVGAISKGFHLSVQYGSMPLILGFVYGVSAITLAIGLWLFRPWALHAAIVYSISIFLWLLNYQYGLNGTYTMPFYFFILYAIFIFLLLALLIYYVQKKLKKQTNKTR